MLDVAEDILDHPTNAARFFLLSGLSLSFCSGMHYLCWLNDSLLADNRCRYVPFDDGFSNFSLNYRPLLNFLNLGGSGLFCDHLLMLLMDHRLVEFVHYLTVLFVNDWLMNLSNLLLVNDRLDVLVDHLLMMLVHHVLMMLVDNLLMMLMDHILVMLLHYGCADMRLDPCRLLMSDHLALPF